MSTKSHAHTRCETLAKSSISTRGYAEIHIQRPFFDNKNSIWKNLGFKIQTVEMYSSASSTHTNFYFWKKLKSRFLVAFQSFVFGQFWAKFAALAMADCMPELWLKSLKPHSFWTVSLKTMCNDFLDSYNQYAKSQLPHELIAFKTPCPNQQKAILAPFVL
jgi:tRNA(Glu) U13 pseudouridine synthase TruD